jgi:D-alanyl-D-alanine dipeptidase
MQPDGDGMKMSVFGAMALAVTAGACATGTSDSGKSRVLADIRMFTPAIRHDIRYATANNFTGRKVTGYQSAKCLLHEPVAQALANVEQGLRSGGYALVIYDCYRPTIAVADFMRWASDAADQSTKAAYYPDIDKSALVPDYIAEKSGHSKGATVDVGLLDCRSEPCQSVDMGTPFDYFGVRANTDYPDLSAAQKGARKRLLDAMTAQGFVNYPLEWWHYTWKAAPLPDEAYDFPIE